MSVANDYQWESATETVLDWKARTHFPTHLNEEYSSFKDRPLLGQISLQSSGEKVTENYKKMSIQTSSHPHINALIVLHMEVMEYAEDVSFFGGVV